MKQKIIFPSEPDSFYSDTKRLVKEYFNSEDLNKYGENKIIAKFIILKTIFWILYGLIFFFDSHIAILFGVYAILGPLSIILAINISHDAVHGVAHKNRQWNKYFCKQMDIIGANSYAWTKRHQFGHHTFPNTLDKDPDLTQTEVVKILPDATHRAFHKYQHIYVPFLYALYTINWIFIRDFKDFFSPKSKIQKIPTIEYIKLFGFKALYLMIHVGLPWYFTSYTIGQILCAFLILHVAASYFLTIALVPSHVSEHSVFVTPDQSGKMPYSWSHHQMVTTTDFATKSKLITWIFGGFNHHVCHHLFPKVSHVHYAALTPIIKKMAQKHGIPYTHENSLWSAYISHYNLLKNNGKKLVSEF